MIPLTFEFSRTLKKKIKENEFEEILELISKTVTDKKGNVIYKSQLELIYKGSDSVGRQHIFAPINKGIFKVEPGKDVAIKYTIYLTTVVLFGAIVGILSGIISQQFSVGIVTFLFVGGIYWLVAVMRHSAMLNDIGAKIDNIKSDSE